MAGDADRGLAQRGKAYVVVGVIGAGFVIDPGAIVERRAIHEEVSHALAD